MDLLLPYYALKTLWLEVSVPVLENSSEVRWVAASFNENDCKAVI